jgi:AAA domain
VPAEATPAAASTATTSSEILNPIRALIEQAKAGPVWHRPVLRLVAMLIARGTPACVIEAMAPELTITGYTAAQTRADLAAMIEGARRKGYAPEGVDSGDDAADVSDRLDVDVDDVMDVQPAVSAEPPIWVASGGWAESEIPQRPWIAPGFLLRHAVTLLSGPPSGFKSTLALGWAVAIVLNRPYGQFRPRVQGPVLVYDVEDDEVEQQRRLSAVLRQFGASPGDIAGKLIRIGPKQIGTLLVHNRDGATVASAALQGIEEQIRIHKPVAFLADPLSELHVEEENDNTALRAVIAEFRSRAITHDMAVCIAHHTRKGGSTSPGDPDVARGASAIIGAVRVAFTLTGMSEADATAFGLPTGRADREPYVRLDSAKQNYAPLGDAVWFQEHVYLLANGENVPAAVPWEPPVQKVPTEADLSALVTAIKYGAPGGEPWSPKLSRDPRSLRALLTDHGFHGDAQKAVMGKLLTECQVEQARFRSFVRKTSALGLHVDFLPAAEWLEEPSE